ncbi:MAG: hypothetical protein ACXQTY_00015 [Candidatus Methanogasteraceae archaeon]
MDLRRTIVVSMIALLAVEMSTGMTAAYTIDGNLSDWGVDVNTGGDWGLDATWVPNAGVQFQIEDNVDPGRDSESARWHDGTPAYATGVHISGIGHDYSNYYESRVTGPNRTGWAFPTGGTNQSAEKYDMEAMYVDEDADHLYFAVVLSCDAASVPGDLGLDVTSVVSGDGYACEYGIVIQDSAGTYTASSRNIISVSDWSECTIITECSPGLILDGTTVGTATVAYVKNGPDPEPDIESDYPATYIIEGKIPKSVIGNTASVSLHYTVECGNDEITIHKGPEAPPEAPPEEQVPAFAPSSIIALIGMLCVIGGSRIGRRFN